jgi:hypothetical protein
VFHKVKNVIYSISVAIKLIDNLMKFCDFIDETSGATSLYFTLCDLIKLYFMDFNTVNLQNDKTAPKHMLVYA